jgi:hypothetical protein
LRAAATTASAKTAAPSVHTNTLGVHIPEALTEPRNALDTHRSKVLLDARTLQHIGGGNGGPPPPRHARCIRLLRHRPSSYLHLSIYISVYAYLCIYLSIYIGFRVYIYTYIYIYIYIYVIWGGRREVWTKDSKGRRGSRASEHRASEHLRFRGREELVAVVTRLISPTPLSRHIHISTYIYIYVYMNISIHIYIYIYTYTYIYIHIMICIYIYMLTLVP